MVSKIEHLASRLALFDTGDAVLAAVSAGPDSVALLNVLMNLRDRFDLRVGIAHLHHQIRGSDADRDADFVAGLAKRWGLPLYMDRADVPRYRQTNKLSLEEAARRVRYAFLEKTALENGYTRIALGHHGDDQAESVLMNLLRGSGPLGLSGMRMLRDQKFVRPFLRVSRGEILDFLNRRQIPYRLDPTNMDTTLVRNRIRLELIPHLKNRYNANLTETLTRTADILACEEDWMRRQVKRLYQKMAHTPKPGAVGLSISDLKALHPAARRRIIRLAIRNSKGDLRRIGFTHTETVEQLVLEGPSTGRLDLPDRIRVERNAEELFIFKCAAPLRKTPSIIQIPSIVQNKDKPTVERQLFATNIHTARFDVGEFDLEIRFRVLPKQDIYSTSQAGQWVVFFDMRKVSAPLVLRYSLPDDRFIPLGMQHHQKIRKYLSDHKVPPQDRADCKVLVADGRVIWLMGYRIDDRVKIDAHTQNVLQVEVFLA